MLLSLCRCLRLLSDADRLSDEDEWSGTMSAEDPAAGSVAAAGDAAAALRPKMEKSEPTNPLGEEAGEKAAGTAAAGAGAGAPAAAKMDWPPDEPPPRWRGGTLGQGCGRLSHGHAATLHAEPASVEHRSACFCDGPLCHVGAVVRSSQ